MPRASVNAGVLLSAPELNELLERNKLRQKDAAWMIGKSERIVRGWCIGEYAVPQYAAVILRAYDVKALTARTLRAIIGRDPPA